MITVFNNYLILPTHLVAAVHNTDEGARCYFGLSFDRTTTRDGTLLDKEVSDYLPDWAGTISWHHITQNEHKH